MGEPKTFIKSERGQIYNSRNLIKEVKIRRPLWDRSEDGYNHRATQVRLWKEVSLKLGPSSAIVRKKWKGLRDVYRKELKRQCALLKTGPNEQAIEPRWKFFRSMMFLREQLLLNDLPPLLSEKQPKLEIEFADTSNNSSDSNNYSDSIDVNVPLTAPEENIHTRNMQCGVSEPVPGSLQFQNDFDRVEKERNPLAFPFQSSEYNEDSDILFFRSLLPFMKSLDFNKKMVLRAKIQHFVCDFLYGNSTNSSVNSKTNSLSPA